MDEGGEGGNQGKGDQGGAEGGGKRVIQGGGDQGGTEGGGEGVTRGGGDQGGAEGGGKGVIQGGGDQGGTEKEGEGETQGGGDKESSERGGEGVTQGGGDQGEKVLRFQTGQELIGSSQPIVALVGDDVILPCHLNPSSDAFDLTVEWARPDLDPRYILVQRNGEELEPKKNRWFTERSRMFPEELGHGNVSLKLSKVKLQDGGAYRCFIPSLLRAVTVQLLVGAVSSPVVQVSQSSDGVVLQCESKGWYPEPEMFWLDAEGNLLSSALTETLRGPDGLYTVSSRLTVERRHRNTFTCRVTQRDINHSRDILIHVTAPSNPSPTHDPPGPPVVTISVCAALVLVLVPVAIFAVWKWRQNRLSKSSFSS
ncbi:butyrophilin subfamily 1 member A1-like [Halichoeres trimaculatus]|uniref:butyrophilin subfamily 1 member A1-like n=1 Tax=Halichoeres trimaculatus TaxID=147232 RepID=UPI003D9F1A54